MDSGILALVVLAQFHQVTVDPEQIRKEFGANGRDLTPQEVLRAARAVGFRARRATPGVRGLKNEILPAIGVGIEGGFFILARVGEDVNGSVPRVLVQEFIPEALRTVTHEELCRIWTGEAILLVPHSGFSLGRFRPSGSCRVGPVLVEF
jgi:subfamily B ATP-binding cassette protein HlyB/CyaB